MSLWRTNILPSLATLWACLFCALLSSPARADIALNADFSPAKDFASHIPLVILDYDQASPREDRLRIRVIDNKGEPNRLNDKAIFEDWVKLRTENNVEKSENDAQKEYGGFRDRKGKNQSGKAGGEDKSSYQLFYAGASESHDISISGLPEAKAWTLLGSNRDRSMLRTYLATQMGAVAGGFPVPQALHCELFFRRNEKYTYQGLYLLAEHVEDGLFPVFGKKPKGESLIVPLVTAIDKDGVRTLEYEMPQDYPAVKTGPDEKMRELIDLLHSDDGVLFFRGLDKLELYSFADVYLLNALMMNFPSDFLPFYFYRDAKGEVGLGAVWDFAYSLDNASTPFEFPYHWDKLYPWYDRLLESSRFNTILRKRFTELSRSEWNIVKLMQRVDVMAKLLLPSMRRDWQRWQDTYQSTEPRNTLNARGELYIRKSSDPLEEINKIKYNLWQNNITLKKAMGDLKWKKVFFNEGKNTRKTVLTTGVFLALFFLVLIYARRKM